MPNLATQLHDNAIHDAIRALRFEAGLSRRVLSHLRGLEKDLLKALAETGDLTSQRKLRALLQEARAAIADRFGGAQSLFDDEIPQFAEVQSARVLGSLNAAMGVDIFSGALTADQAKTLATNMLIEGAPSAEWWAVQEVDTLRKFTNIVRSGMTEGLTGDQMARQVRDMMGTSMRNAQALVRTSVITVNGNAHQAAFEANDDIIDGVTWTSTLDSRTCLVCAGLDGVTWKLREPHPVPAKHFSCRCSIIAKTKSWEQLAREAHGNSTLAKQLDAMDEGTRASMDGQVASSMTYEDWLKGKPAEVQKEILGPARYRLLQSGKLTLRDLTDMTGHELTLDELKRR